MSELWEYDCSLESIDASIWPLYLNNDAIEQYKAFGAISAVSADNYLITPEGELCALKIEASQVITSDGFKPVVFQKLVTSAVGAKIFNPELKGLLFSVLGESSLRGVLDFQNRVEHLIIFSQKGGELNGLTIKNVDKVSIIAGDFFGYFSNKYILNRELENLIDSYLSRHTYFKGKLGKITIKGINALNTAWLFGSSIDCEGTINALSLDTLILSKTSGDSFNDKQCIISADSFVIKHDIVDKVKMELSLTSKNVVIRALNELYNDANINVAETLRIYGKKVSGPGIIKAHDLFIKTEEFVSPYPERIVVSNNFTLMLKDSQERYVGGWYGGELAKVSGLTSINAKEFGVTAALNMGSLYIGIHGVDRVILPTMNIAGCLIIHAQKNEIVLGSIKASKDIEIHGGILFTEPSTFVNAEKELRLKARSFSKGNSYGRFQGGELLDLLILEETKLHGLVLSNQEINIESPTLIFYNKAYGLECGGKATFRVLKFAMSSGSMIRVGDFVVEHYIEAGHMSYKMELYGGKIEVKRDARVIISNILLKMDVFSSLINIGGFLEISTKKITLDKSFIKTRKGTNFVLNAQQEKERNELALFSHPLYQESPWQTKLYIRGEKIKDSCIPAGIEGPLAGAFAIVEMICASESYTRLEVLPPLITLTGSAIKKTSDMPMIQSDVLDIFAVKPQVFASKQYHNPTLELDLSYFNSPSYVKPYQALPGGETALDKYNYYYKKSYPSLFSCGIGIESILETLKIEKSTEILFGSPDIQLDIVNKLILKGISVHSLESVVEGVKHYLDVYYKEGAIGERDCGQMHWLIQSALKQKEALGLVVGMPLSESKYGSIVDPFIWLVYSDYQGIMLLTPVVYFNKESLERSPGKYGAYISAPEGSINLEAGKMLSSGLVSADEVKIGSGAFISVGTIEGSEVGIKGKHIGIIGDVRAKDHLEIVAENQLIISSLKRTHEMVRYGYYNYISEVVKETKLSSGGEIYLSSGDDLNIIGAGVVGQKVHLQSKSGKVVVVPLELYQKTITTGKKYYYEHQSLSYYQAKIEALKENEVDIKNGLVRLSKEVSQGGATGIIIEAGSGILLSGVNVATDRKLRLVSPEDDIKIETPEEYSSMVYSYTKKRGGISGFFGGKKSISIREESYIPLDTQFIAGQVEFVSPKNIEIGVDIITYAVEFDREGATKDSMVKIIPKLSKYSYEVKTKKSGLMFSFSESGHLMLAGSKERIEKRASVQVIPTIIQIGGVSDDPEDKPYFLAYTKGKFVMVSSRIEEYRDAAGKFIEGRKSQIIIEAEDIELESIPDSKFDFALLNEKGSGIGFNVNTQEVALKAGIFGYKEESTRISATHKNPPGFLSQFLHLKSNSLRDVAAVYDAEQMDIHAKIVFHGVAKDSVTESSLTRLMEAGVKLGVKLGSLGRMVDAATRMASQDTSTPEGVINSGFAGLQAYHEALKLLSGQGGMSAGIWAFAHYEEEKSSSTVTKEIPTVIKAGSLEIETDDWEFIGTQIEAYRAYIKAKAVKSKPAEINSESSSSSKSFDVDIPLTQGAPGGLSFGASGSKGQERLMMNARIHIHEDLRLEVTGNADMRGITVSARSLEAFFNSLLLESIQDISKHSSWSGGLGLSTSDISSISGQLGKGNSHVARELTSLIGEEKCHIVVANALRLNGAMIASAHRDANGQYSDHGKLTLRVGELFVQHIYDYDNGYTLGAAISSSAFMPTIGGHKGSGTSYGTIGEGEVECTTSSGICEVDNAYRDVSKPRSWSQDYDVDPITAYIPTERLPELPKDDNGEINWEVAFDNVKNQFADVFKDLSKIINGAFGLREVGVDFKEYSKGASSLEELRGKLEDLNRKIDSDTNLTLEEKAEIKAFNKRLENYYYDNGIGNAKSDSVSSKEDRTVIKVEVSGLKRLAGFVSGVFNDYAAFAEEHPHIAEYGLSAANLVIQTAIAGPLGAANAVKGELVGRAINEVAGGEINKGLGYVIENKAKALMEVDRSLHPIEAMNLAAAGLAVGYIAYLGVSGVKDLIKTTSKLNKHGDIDYSSDIGSKFEGKVEVDTKPSVKSEAEIDGIYKDFKASKISLTEEVKNEIVDVLQKGNSGEISAILKNKLGWDVPDVVFDKLPTNLKGKGDLSKIFRKYGDNPGVRFDGKTESVRIMKGKPGAQWPSQQQDYVKITSNGKVLDFNGNEISPKQYQYPSDHPDAHIPLKEWKQWREWDKP